MSLYFNYDSISEIYDELMQFIPYEEWAKYVNELFFKHLGRGYKMIDLGGGTGSLSIPLSEMGFDALIIDKSHKMLLEAQKKIMGKSVFVLCADIRNMHLKQKFDMAICMYDTVNHLDEKDIMSFFMNTADLLRDGGIFMFDFNTDFGLDVFAFHTQYRNGSSFKSIWKTSYNKNAKVCTLDLAVSDKEGEKNMIFQERAISIEEMDFAISNSGFREKHLYHFLSLSGLKRTSERGMAVCLK